MPSDSVAHSDPPVGRLVFPRLRPVTPAQNVAGNMTMIRLLYDDYGDDHSDLILKIDTIPSFVRVADSYYIADFLRGYKRDQSNRIIVYLQYLAEIIKTIKNNETFCAFDLSDQYIGGLILNKKNESLINVSYAWTDKIQGHSVNYDTINSSVAANRSMFQIVQEWIFSIEGIYKGLEWSENRIINCLQQ